MSTPLLTLIQHDALQAACDQGLTSLDCTLDLDRSRTTVSIGASHWSWQGSDYPYLMRCKDRTVYYWTGEDFAPVQRYGNALIKLIPTPWGAPTLKCVSPESACWNSTPSGKPEAAPNQYALLKKSSNPVPTW